MAAASVQVMNMHKHQYDSLTAPMRSHLNVGYGSDISIVELAGLIQKITSFEGKLTFDTSKPDGTPRKWMDSSRLLSTGWKPRVEIEEGLRSAYADFLSNHLEEK
jgi:GDP-L-fucose synthase